MSRKLSILLCTFMAWSIRPMEAGKGKKITRVRLPEENELANSCYFTYRMNFIICDQSLSPEEAEKAIAAGQCHSDFKIMGADFQLASQAFVHKDGIPPLEAAFWLIGMPENFQSRTMEECPAVMILSYMLIAETTLFLKGPTSALGNGFVRDAVIISRTMKYQDTVMRSWPIDSALTSYQRLHGMVSEQVNRGTNLTVNAITCRCSPAEDLKIMESFLKPIDRKGTTLFIIELCLPVQKELLAEIMVSNGEVGTADELKQKPELADEIYSQTFGDLYPVFENVKITTLNGRTCSPILPQELVVDTGLPDYTIFLGKPGEELTTNVNRRYTDLVMNSLAMNTLVLTDFLHLGNFRAMISDSLTECQMTIVKQVLVQRREENNINLLPAPEARRNRGGGMAGGKQIPVIDRINAAVTDELGMNLQHFDSEILSSYVGEAFVVKREFMEYAMSMGINSNLCAPDSLGNVWYLLFNKPAILPSHEDDLTIPTFLRTLDENSTATLPRTISNYLTHVSI